MPLPVKKSSLFYNREMAAVKKKVRCLLRLLFPALGIPVAGRGVYPLVPAAGISAVAHVQGLEPLTNPMYIVPVKVLTGLAGLVLVFHTITSLQI